MINIKWLVYGIVALVFLFFMLRLMSIKGNEKQGYYDM